MDPFIEAVREQGLGIQLVGCKYVPISDSMNSEDPRTIHTIPQLAGRMEYALLEWGDKIKGIDPSLFAVLEGIEEHLNLLSGYEKPWSCNHPDEM